MQVTGSVTADLREVVPEEIKRRVSSILAAPPGAKAILVVGNRSLVDPGVVAVLRDFAGHLGCIEVQGDPEAVRRWVMCLRDGIEAIL